MPKRVSSRKETSEEVQGEGSWVIMTGLKVKEMKAQRVVTETEKTALAAYRKNLRKHQKLQEQDPDLEDLDAYTTDFNSMDAGIDTLKKHILDWNWVDDEGEPLPNPQEDEDVFDELTDTEVTFLINRMMGVDEVKN